PQQVRRGDGAGADPHPPGARDPPAVLAVLNQFQQLNLYTPRYTVAAYPSPGRWTTSRPCIVTAFSCGPTCWNQSPIGAPMATPRTDRSAPMGSTHTSERAKPSASCSQMSSDSHA